MQELFRDPMQRRYAIIRPLVLCRDRTATQRPATSPPQLPLLDSHSYPERSQARCEVMQLSVQGWSTTSISRFWHVSRPTINAWIGRFERDNLASLEDKGSAPKTPSRKVWLPAIRATAPPHNPHPDAPPLPTPTPPATP